MYLTLTISEYFFSLTYIFRTLKPYLVSAEGRDVAWPFSSGHLKLLNQTGFSLKQKQNVTIHLRCLTPSKCQLIIALGEGHYKTSQPNDKQWQCVLWERLWYFVEKQIKASAYTHKQCLRIYFSGRIYQGKLVLSISVCQRENN